MSKLGLTTFLIFQVVKVVFPIQCYDCIKDHPINPKPCPGQLVDYPSSTACRIAVLGDNSIVEQTVTPSNLCAAKNIHRFQLGIARKYRVAGRVSCCYTSGCNKDIFSAIGSVETQAVPSPSEAFQTRPLLQVRDFKSIEMK